MNRTLWTGPSRLALTALVAGGLVTAATLAPASEVAVSASNPANPTTLAPVVSAALSCPGPEFTGVDGVEDMDVPASLGAATAPDTVLPPTVKADGEGTLTLRSGTVTSPQVSERAVTTTLGDLAAGRASDVVATGALAPGLAASQEWAVARPEIRGLATVSCARPGSDVWLLAGGGAPGRQERLILTNPGANEVTVDLQVQGAKGVIPAPTGSTVVPARGRVALLVDAITGAEVSPVVRVRANGGSVRAVMSDVWLDGSVAAGAETTVPTAEPSTRQIIPGAFMAQGGSLRIAVPGRQQAVVSARILGKDGPVPVPGGGVTRVAGRSAGELTLTGLPLGLYAVELTSDVPIVASLFSSWRTGTAPGDFVWAPSTAATTGLLGAAFPKADTAGRAVNVVASGGAAKVAVTWQADNAWNTRVVDLGKDTSTSVGLGAAQSVWVQRVSGTGEIRAGVGTVMGVGSARLVSVSPLVDSAVTSTVSRARPVS